MNMRTSGQPLTRNEELLGMLLGLWAIIGLFLDGWAHSHQKPDSFFTPWHAVLYSGFTTAALWAVWTMWRRRRPQRRLLHAAPPGHLVTLAGFGVFGAGAVGDLIWHEVFGVEANVEALLSPTHLLLLLGATISLSAPVRTMLRSPAREPSWKEFLPALLSLTLLTSLGAFFLGYLSPFSTGGVGFANATTHTHDLSRITPQIASELRENWTLGALFVTTIVLILPALFAVRRWKTPRGAFLFLYTFLFILQAGLNDFDQWPLIAMGVVVGLVVDALIQRRVPAWLIGALIPLAAWSTYFLIFELDRGVGWSPDLWAGVTLMMALVGGLVGSLVSDSATAQPTAVSAG